MKIVEEETPHELFICVFRESEGFMSSRYDFVTARGNTQCWLIQIISAVFIKTPLWSKLKSLQRFHLFFVR